MGKTIEADVIVGYSQHETAPLSEPHTGGYFCKDYRILRVYFLKGTVVAYTLEHLVRDSEMADWSQGKYDTTQAPESRRWGNEWREQMYFYDQQRIDPEDVCGWEAPGTWESMSQLAHRYYWVENMPGNSGR